MRDSSSEPDCYALSYSFGGRIQHKLIETTSSGLRFRAADMFFPKYDRKKHKEAGFFLSGVLLLLLLLFVVVVVCLFVCLFVCFVCLFVML